MVKFWLFYVIDNIVEDSKTLQLDSSGITLPTCTDIYTLLYEDSVMSNAEDGKTDEAV